MSFTRAAIRWFVPYREFLDRCWDMAARKTRAQAFFIYLQMLAIVLTFDWLAELPFDDTGSIYAFIDRFPPSLFMTIGLTAWAQSLRKLTPARAAVCMGIAVLGGYYGGAWLGLLPIIHIMQQPLKHEEETGSHDEGQ